MGGQLADGVVDLHLAPGRLVRAAELAQLVHGEEGIVNERVGRSGMVDVDDVDPIGRRGRAVPVALAEMSCWVERLYGRDEQGEVEGAFFARL